MAEKITCPVKLGLTESEFNDLSRICAMRDRSMSEYIRVHLIRPHLYGTVPRTGSDVEWSVSASAPL